MCPLLNFTSLLQSWPKQITSGRNFLFIFLFLSSGNFVSEEKIESWLTWWLGVLVSCFLSLPKRKTSLKNFPLLFLEASLFLKGKLSPDWHDDNVAQFIASGPDRANIISGLYFLLVGWSDWESVAFTSERLFPFTTFITILLKWGFRGSKKA